MEHKRGPEALCRCACLQYGGLCRWGVRGVDLGVGVGARCAACEGPERHALGTVRGLGPFVQPSIELTGAGDTHLAPLQKLMCGHVQLVRCRLRASKVPVAAPAKTDC